MALNVDPLLDAINSGFTLAANIMSGISDQGTNIGDITGALIVAILGAAAIYFLLKFVFRIPALLKSRSLKLGNDGY